MPVKSYTTGPNTTINDDLKIFMGKSSEIKEILDAKRVVNRKWYLAWDTGEIYIGNGVQKLIRFGGTANNLSKGDIEEIISNYTKEDLRVIKVQLADVLKKYNETTYEINKLRNDTNEAINNLNNNTIKYIEEKIDEVLSSAESITYSKNQINDLISQSYNKVSENFIDNNELRDELNNYVSYEYADSNILKYATGNTLVINASKRINGYFFCTADSTDTNLTYERGHTYLLNNGLHEDVTAIGSGVSSTDPVINLLLDGKSSSEILVGDNFSKVNTLVTFTIDNSKYMKGTLTFYENKQSVKTDISLTLGSFYYNTRLVDLTKGTYEYSLVGQSKDDKTIIGTYTLKVIAPIYYGSAGSTLPSNDTIKNFSNKMTEVVSGTYDITTKQNEYIWICIPSDLSINSFSLNGFTAPFNSYELTTLTFNNVTQEYKAYRSYSSLQAGTISLNVN